MPPVTFDDLHPSGAKGAVSFDDLHPPTPEGPIRRRVGEAAAAVTSDLAPPQGVAETVARDTLPIAHDVQTAGDLINVPLAAVGGAAEHGANFLQRKLGKPPAINLPPWLQAALDVTGPAGSAVRMTNEYAGGQRSLPRDVGDLAQAATPVPGLEAIEGISTAARASKIAKESKVPMAVAREMLKKGIPESEIAKTIKENQAALERLGLDPYSALTVPGLRKISEILAQNYFFGGPLRQRIRGTEDAVEKATQRMSQYESRRVTPAAAGQRVSHAAQQFQASSPETAEKLAGATPTERKAILGSLKKTPVRYAGFGPKSTALYSDAKEAIGPLTHPITMPQTRRVLRDLSHAFADPRLRGMFQDPVVQQLRAALLSSRGTIPFEDARLLRTKLRDLRQASLKDPTVRGSISDSDIRKLYAAITDDLQSGAKALGTLWGGAKRGEQAAAKWKRADSYYRAGNDRIDNALSSYYGKGSTPSDVFHSLLGAAKGGSRQDLGALLQMRRSLPPEDWSAFTSAVIDVMGRATPGRESAEAPFSLATFLTNYNRLNEPAAQGTHAADTGLKVLFGGKSGREQTQMLADLNRVASQFRELERGRNVSESASHMIVGGGLMLGPSFILHNPMAAAIAAVGGNSASALLASPGFARWLARLPTKGAPEESARAQRMAAAWLASVGSEAGSAKETPQR